jgi:membrane-associated HD superfamily phosphohydrolase
MSINAGREGPQSGFLGALRVVALIAVVAGAGGSLSFMFLTGRHNPSRVLMLLFTLWVLSPFVAVVFASAVSRRASVMTQATYYAVMLVLTLASLAIYGEVALGPPRAKPAYAFLVVPLASWLLIAVGVPIVAFVSGRWSRPPSGR